jgi:membrane protein
MRKEIVLAFINDEALSRRAAIAFYTVTSIAPVLLIPQALLSGITQGSGNGIGACRGTLVKLDVFPEVRGLMAEACG